MVSIIGVIAKGDKATAKQLEDAWALRPTLVNANTDFVTRVVLKQVDNLLSITPTVDAPQVLLPMAMTEK
eukprot:3097727-Prorocentrum_lima.AAC.1